MPMPATPQLTLFQRDDCHLCDLALDLLAAARVAGRLSAQDTVRA